VVGKEREEKRAVTKEKEKTSLSTASISVVLRDPGHCISESKR